MFPYRAFFLIWLTYCNGFRSDFYFRIFWQKKIRTFYQKRVWVVQLMLRPQNFRHLFFLILSCFCLSGRINEGHNVKKARSVSSKTFIIFLFSSVYLNRAPLKSGVFFNGNSLQRYPLCKAYEGLKVRICPPETLIKYGQALSFCQLRDLRPRILSFNSSLYLASNKF